MQQPSHFLCATPELQAPHERAVSELPSYDAREPRRRHRKHETANQRLLIFAGQQKSQQLTMPRILRPRFARRVLEMPDRCPLQDRNVVDDGPVVAATFENAVTRDQLAIPEC